MTPAVESFSLFTNDMAVHNPCIAGTDEYKRWLSGALNGRANRMPPTERSSPAYYEGWQWGREWAESQRVK